MVASLVIFAVGQQAAKLFSFIALIMMAAPSLVPSIGSLINTALQMVSSYTYTEV